MKIYHAFGILASAAIASTASSASACAERIYPSEAIGRNAWAATWGYITPDEEMQLNIQGLYVEFLNGCFRLATAAPCGQIVPVSAGGAFVPGLMVGSFCPRYDCFTPTQRILVEGRYVGIEDAATAESTTVTALATGSTIAKPKMSEQPVASLSWAPVAEDIFVLEGNSGEQVEVTAGHPMVLNDGSVVPAKGLREGDVLAGANGEAVRLVRVSTYPYEGKVWNVEPKSEKKIENVIVAEGILTGSMKFQTDWGTERFRLFVRDHVDVKELVKSL